MELSIPRGNTREYTLILQLEGEQVALRDGDTVYFTVKDDPDTSAVRFQKVVILFTDGAAKINIRPGDTNGMNYGAYSYDVKWKSADGAHELTVVGPDVFRITEAVTWN